MQEEINTLFLQRFKKVLASFPDRKFVIVLGGGRPARLYIRFLEAAGCTIEECSRIGMDVTRLNAQAFVHFFRGRANKTLPRSFTDVVNLLKRHSIVIAGALRFEKENTSDATAAHLARYIQSDFINITDVDGLFSADPKKQKHAHLVPSISFDDFYVLAQKLHYKPGQHFVLDQHAAKIIREHKVTTYIVGSDLHNLKCLLQGKAFRGTTIS